MIDFHLNVAEMFGPTVQGEGPNAGQLASFLRLSGCNLSCSWCDTPFTWDWTRYDRAEESDRLDVSQVAAKLDDLPGRIVVTGGEPLLQAAGLATLWQHVAGRTWDVETNGTRPLRDTDGMWDTIVVSPKVGPTAGQGDAPYPDAIPGDHPRAVWKFVAAAPRDVRAAALYVEQRGIDPSRVWLMPEGTTPTDVSARWRWIAEAAIDRGWNATHRLHTLAWSDDRGH